MNHRSLLIAFSAGLAVAATTLAFGSSLSGCADYRSDPGANAAGMGATSSSAGTPGSGGQGGGGAGLPATGGAAAGTGPAGAPSVGGSAGAGGAGSGTAGGGAAAGGSAGSASGAAGGPSAMCENYDNVTACGGDVAGTWMVGGACVKVSGTIDLAGLGADCKSGEITAGTIMVSGTFTATADGTFTDATQTTGEQTLELPQTCKTLSGTETTCKRISNPLKSIGFATSTCVDNTATMGCTCTTTVDQMGGLGLVYPNFPTSGSYAVADNNLTLSDGIRDIAYPYCVAGTTLTLSQPAMAKTGTYAGTVVLQKQ